MKNDHFELECLVLGDQFMKDLDDSWNEREPFVRRTQPVVHSTSELVDLFIEYRKRVGRRGSR